MVVEVAPEVDLGFDWFGAVVGHGAVDFVCGWDVLYVHGWSFLEDCCLFGVWMRWVWEMQGWWYVFCFFFEWWTQLVRCGVVHWRTVVSVGMEVRRRKGHAMICYSRIVSGVTGQTQGNTRSQDSLLLLAYTCTLHGFHRN